MIMDLSLRQIRAYLAVARTLSFTRAAAETNLSQPALTVQIRSLEQQLGIKLFDRNSRSVELTRLGRELVPVFERLLREFDETVTGVRDIARHGVGSVRLGALPSFAAGILPDVIVRFRARFPRVALTIKDAIASRVMDLVVSEDVDLGVVGGEPIHADLDVIHRTEDRLNVILPAGHPLSRKKRIGVEELAAFPLILMDPATSVRATVDAALAAAGHRVEAACEVTYMMTAVGMVRAGLGITILPASAHEIRAEPDLVARVIDDPRFVRSIAVVRKRRRTLPPAAENFMVALVEYLDSRETKTGRGGHRSARGKGRQAR
ncbi:LysR family transcriptional regulator [Bradyrhizobium sp. CB82]|uniref:LysR family transcriptional regulator n=1 Tax=Bradyrhizobium sp. CB82 TaxID=3039159 RepID=UPI0024B224EF|nr:LysR family transcriptional regulator [Bradyrhizobium sp. CB82]WFU38113.1 LysR family transcriptional regulator [Bradyrhizobium sp. CB82]